MKSSIKRIFPTIMAVLFLTDLAQAQTIDSDILQSASDLIVVVGRWFGAIL